jgi:hypothetical protein
MKNISSYLSIILLFAVAAAHGQTASGIITDKATGKPLAYTNIGLPRKNIGTTSNEAGKYSLAMPGNINSDTVKISIIGYEPQVITVQYLLEHPNITLLRRNTMLNDIVIKPKHLKHKLLGNTQDNKNVIIGFSNYQMGYEVGTLVKLRCNPTFIDSVRINIARCSADSIFFRLNIAEEVNDSFINILPVPIYVRAAAKDALERLVVDISPYHLVAYHNLLISVEVVRNMEQKQIWLCATLFGSHAYLRQVSQAPWGKISVAGPSISAYVSY